jgi:ankyrin repeat protein
MDLKKLLTKILGSSGAKPDASLTKIKIKFPGYERHAQDLLDFLETGSRSGSTFDSFGLPPLPRPSADLAPQATISTGRPRAPTRAPTPQSHASPDDTLVLQRAQRALVKAACLGRIADMRETLALGARPGLADENGITPLMWAARHGQRRSADLLIALCDTSARDKHGMTALLHACQATSVPCVEALAHLPGHDAVDAEGRGAIAYAALESAASSMANQVLSAKGGPDRPPFLPEDGLGCVQALLAAGHGARAADCHGNTPLMFAAASSGASLVAALLHHSDALAADAHGTTALMKASASGSADCVALLARYGGFEQANSHGRNALMHAAALGHLACVEMLLLAQGARAVDHDGNDALMIAACGARLGHELVCQALIPHSDLDRRALDGKRAADHLPWIEAARIAREERTQIERHLASAKTPALGPRRI